MSSVIMYDPNEPTTSRGLEKLASHSFALSGASIQSPGGVVDQIMVVRMLRILRLARALRVVKQLPGRVRRRHPRTCLGLIFFTEVL